MPVIDMKDLTKVFHTRMPKPGLKGKLRDLWSHEHRDVIAVDHINCSRKCCKLVGEYLGLDELWGKTILLPGMRAQLFHSSCPYTFFPAAMLSTVPL